MDFDLWPMTCNWSPELFALDLEKVIVVFAEENAVKPGEGKDVKHGEHGKADEDQTLDPHSLDQVPDPAKAETHPAPGQPETLLVEFFESVLVSQGEIRVRDLVSIPKFQPILGAELGPLGEFLAATRAGGV